MARLSPIDKRCLEELFEMSGGYVLDFSNRTFASLFKDILKLDIFDIKYSTYGVSKGKRLAAFWDTESNEEVAKILVELLKVVELKNKHIGNKNFEIAKRIVEDLTRKQAKVPVTFKMKERETLSIFISHRDSKKKEAKDLAMGLSDFGNCFVAHDSIEPMNKWKDDIYAALEQMDAFICFITEDYYESHWTNQEIGYALAKGIPIFLYSHDGTDPKGFNQDVQAIKKGKAALLECFKKIFRGHPSIKNGLLAHLLDSRNGTFANAKVQFMKILGLQFNDEEIDRIVEAINGPAKYINQLSCLLHDPLTREDAETLGRGKYNSYRDVLEKEILSQHSNQKYYITEVDKGKYEIKEK